MTTTCRWCLEPIEQTETGRPREFCDDAERAAYNRRRASALPGWDAPTDFHEPMNRATWEAERRFYAAHPERTPPSWLPDLYR